MFINLNSAYWDGSDWRWSRHPNNKIKDNVGNLFNSASLIHRYSFIKIIFFKFSKNRKSSLIHIFKNSQSQFLGFKTFSCSKLLNVGVFDKLQHKRFKIGTKSFNFDGENLRKMSLNLNYTINYS